MDDQQQQRDDGEEATRDVQARRGSGIVVSVRLSAQEAEQLQTLARMTGKSLSEVARESLRASLSNAALHVLPAGFTATAANGIPLSIFGNLSPTTTAPVSTVHHDPRVAVTG